MELKSNSGTQMFMEDESIYEVSNMDLVEMIRRGNDGFNYAAKLKDHTSASNEIISTWLGISAKTYSSYLNERTTPNAITIEHLIMLILLFRHGSRVFDSSNNFDIWLGKENFFFDGDRPISFLETIAGIRYIDSRLTAMEYGDNV